MSSTTSRLAAVAALVLLGAVHVSTTHAQTLGELAEAQRAKQQTELLRQQRELAEAEAAANGKQSRADTPKVDPAEAAAAAKKAQLAARPKIILHALYARGGAWVAELASGQGLALALTGMEIYGHRVVGVDQRGLVLSKPCGAADVRARRACGQRILVLGEAI